MKKSIVFFAALLTAMVLASSASAQSPYIQSGKFLIQGNVGYGGGSFIAAGASFPIVPQVNLEYIVADKPFGEGSGALGIGASGAVGIYSVSGVSVTSIFVGAQGNYHFTPKTQFDPYIGLALGFYTYSIDFNIPGFGSLGSATSSGLGWSGHVGANYWLSNGFGLHGRLGYGVAIASLGVTVGF